MRWSFAAEKRGELKRGTAARWASQTRSIKRLPERLAAKRAVRRTSKRKAGR